MLLLTLRSPLGSEHGVKNRFNGRKFISATSAEIAEIYGGPRFLCRAMFAFPEFQRWVILMVVRIVAAHP